MIINHANLAILNQAYNAAFQSGLTTAAPMWNQLAMMVPSTTSTEKYAWLGAITKFREWLGERTYQNLKQSDYSIKNKTWENTVSVNRDEIEDDQYGVYKPVIQQLGQDAATHPDELVFALLQAGFSTRCFDGQYFFDTDHPVGQPGQEVSVSNFQGGSGAAWFLVDTTKVIKPIIYQRRRPYAFQSKTSLTDESVFSRNEFVGRRRTQQRRLWPVATGLRFGRAGPAGVCRCPRLDAEPKADNGKPLVIRAAELWVPPSLEQAALEVIQADRLANGASNVMRGTAKVVVCPYLG